MATNNAINVQGPTPAFNVYVSSTISNATGDGTLAIIPANIAVHNSGCWDISTYTFTAPIEGYFNFNGTLNTYPFTSSHTSYTLYIRVNSDDYKISQCNPYTTAGTGYEYLGDSFSQTYYLTASDTVQFYVEVSGGTATVNIYGTKIYSNISGFYIPSL